MLPILDHQTIRDIGVGHATHRREMAKLAIAALAVEELAQDAGIAEVATKTAALPLGALLQHAIGPAMIGGLASYATTPDDPYQERRNLFRGMGAGAGIGMGAGLLGALMKNPELASQLAKVL